MVERKNQDEFVSFMYGEGFPQIIGTASKYVDRFHVPNADVTQLVKQYRTIATEIASDSIVGRMIVFGPVKDRRTLRFYEDTKDRIKKQSRGRFHNKEEEIVEGLGNFFAASIMARNELTLQQFIDTPGMGILFGKPLRTKKVADLKPLSDAAVSQWPETQKAIPRLEELAKEPI